LLGLAAEAVDAAPAPGATDAGAVTGAAVVAFVAAVRTVPTPPPLPQDASTTALVPSTAANERDDVAIDLVVIAGSPCLSTCRGQSPRA
jgi:hypothetical protein